MRTRRTIAMSLVAVLAAVTLSVAACSSDDAASGAKKSTTTTAKRETTTTVSDEDFKKAASDIQSGMKTAGDDPCKLVTQLNESGSALQNPGNAAQRKLYTETGVALYRALANAAPADLAADAATIRSVADQLEKEGKAAGYSEAFLKAPKAVTSNPKAGEALSNVSQAIQKKCGPATTAEPSTTPTDQPTP